MVYQRTRNSRYANYARSCQQLGRTVNFNIPSRQSANFVYGPVMDMVGPQFPIGMEDIGNAVNHAKEMFGPPTPGSVEGVMGKYFNPAPSSYIQNQISDIANRLHSVNISDRVSEVMQKSINNSQRLARLRDQDNANLLKGAAGLTGLLGGAVALDKGLDRAFPIAGEVMEAPSRLQGIKEKAGNLLRNRNAQAAMIGGGLGGGIAATQLANRQQQQ